MIGVVAILTMLVGSVLAVTQTDIKRLLAYSSIAHAGFILTGFVGSLARDVAGDGSRVRVLFYLVAYGFATSARSRSSPWSATAAARPPTCPGGPGWARGRRSSPGVFAFFLLAFAGIPLTAASPASSRSSRPRAGGAWPLVIVGVLPRAIAAFFYVRVIVLMFFSEPGGRGPERRRCRAAHQHRRSRSASPRRWCSGIVPGPVLDLRQRGAFIR